ncbi:MAG: hypothetical protein COA96_07630 [SAR86 cluster bacterium]|uniref:Competence protein ComFB n=1 Tax=SAR86 cluster bacterium TaxID=2030880 RepID=A0A2A5B2Q0_9GAMM|nr:MAG: hypothetical protein COA96_07630 [SAR86 cluster bacterium]
MDFETVHNFYERLVLEKVVELSSTELEGSSDGALCDIACVALNRLPAYYVRHNVDTYFYMPVIEHHKVDAEVDDAVSYAINFIAEHQPD